MAKLTLSDILAGYLSATGHTANNTLIEAAVENTLSRDGTSPNQMEANLDMNSNKIVNLPDAATAQEPVTKSQLDAAGTATTFDASISTYTPTGTSAVARTVSSKLDERVTVEDFGAVGDGSTVDYAAFTAARDHVESLGGGTVYMESASYNLAGNTLVLDSQGVEFNGAGMGGQTAGKNGSRLMFSSGGGIQLTQDGSNAWGSNLKNVHIDGQNTCEIGLQVGNDDGTVNVSWWGTIDNVYITGCDIGRLMIGSQNGTLRKVHCESNKIGTIYRRGTVTAGGLANTATVEISCRNYNNDYYGKIVEQAFGVKFLGCTDESNGYKNVVNGPLAWVAGATYRLGEEVTNDSGKLYTCTTAGTAAGSGGPTGTSTGISDNTVEWDYISAVGSISINYDGGWEEGASDAYGTEQGYGSVKYRDYNFNTGTKLYDLIGGSLLLDECFYSESATKPTMRIGADSTCLVRTLNESYAHFDVDADAKFSWSGRNQMTADEDPATAGATQAFNRGDFVWAQGDTTLAAGYPLGWACITTGSPGTWIEVGQMRQINPVETHTSGPVTVTEYGHTYLCNATSGAITVNLPDINAGEVPKGKQYLIKKTDSSGNAVTVNRTGSTDTIEGATSVSLASQWDALHIIVDTAGDVYIKYV